MKKLMIMVMACMLIFSQISVLANDVNSVRDADLEEINQLCQNDDFLTKIEFVVKEEGKSFDKTDVLEWSDFIKVYTDASVFSLNTNNKASLYEHLEQRNYCYVASAFYDELEIEVTFAKGQEVKPGIEEVLTVNQYNSVVENVGKWMVTSIGVINENETSIYGSLQNLKVTNYSDVVVVSSNEGLYYPVVIKFEGEIAEDVMLIYDESAYPALGDSTMNKKTIPEYTFLQVADIVRAYDTSGTRGNISYVGVDDTKAETSRTTGNYKRLTVTKYSQEKSNWCWAACAKMLGKYYTGNAISQSNIVAYTQGSSSGNSVATGTEIKKAITYATSSTVTFSGVQSYATMENKIYVGEKPFAITIKKENGYGHLNVVNGINGLVASEQINLIDPVANNGTKWYEYEALVNGTEFPYGEGIYVDTYLVH